MPDMRAEPNAKRIDTPDAGIAGHRHGNEIRPALQIVGHGQLRFGSSRVGTVHSRAMGGAGTGE
jgi:hypothetical protein